MEKAWWDAKTYELATGTTWKVKEENEWIAWEEFKWKMKCEKAKKAKEDEWKTKIEEA